jgi:hypothetical protein
MIRVLVMIAVTGFLVSVVTLSTAIAIGGPDAVTRGAWAWGPDGRWGSAWRGHNHWSFDDHHHYGRHRHDGGGPQTTREIAWSGGDALVVDIPADVQYTQGPGPAKLVVTGPQDVVADIVVEHGQVRLAHDHDRWSDGVSIVMTAPSVSRFEMDGSGKLDIANYKQDRLALDLRGDSEVTAKGETKAIDLNISGSASADLGGLKARDAKVEIDGSGDATIAPTESANLDISGSGDVTMLTRPPKLETDISGSGSVHHDDGAASATPAAPAPRRGRT